MGLTKFAVCFLLFFVGCGEFQTSCAGNNYMITWDDLSLNDLQFTTGSGSDGHSHGNHNGNGKQNGSRVIVVDRHGRGDSVTVQGAVDMVPENNSQRVKIHIRPGLYNEKVMIPQTKPFISFIGDHNHPSGTVIRWHNKACDTVKNGTELGTFRTASVAVESDYFCATGITFENTVRAEAGAEGMQAVALKLSGERAMLYRVNILGTQDTLLDNSGSHYFYQCYIRGTVDFIFGNARSLYQECSLRSIATRYGAIAAHHRESPYENTGFSFVKCKVRGSGRNYLGRAWGPYSRTIYSNCHFDHSIDQEGWSDWGEPARQRTAEFAEFNCTGTGANRTRRVRWSKAFVYQQARVYLDKKFIDGEQWLRV